LHIIDKKLTTKSNAFVVDCHAKLTSQGDHRAVILRQAEKYFMPKRIFKTS
jgi:hypothetical protein